MTFGFAQIKASELHSKPTPPKAGFNESKVLPKPIGPNFGSRAPSPVNTESGLIALFNAQRREKELEEAVTAQRAQHEAERASLQSQIEHMQAIAVANQQVIRPVLLHDFTLFRLTRSFSTAQALACSTLQAQQLASVVDQMAVGKTLNEMIAHTTSVRVQTRRV